VWKKNPDDAGIRQRGHARLQWVANNRFFFVACKVICRLE